MKETALEGISRLKKIAPFIMAMVLFLGGFLDLRNALLTESVDSAHFKIYVLSSTIRMSFAIVMFLDPNKTVPRTIAFYAFALGMGRLISYFPNLFEQDNAAFIIGIIMVIMGGNLSYSGFRYMSGNTRGRTGMSVNATLQISIIIFLEMVPYIINSIAGVPIEMDAGSDVIRDAVSVIQYALLLLMLDTAEVKYGTPLEKMNSRLDSVRMSYTLDSGLRLDRQQAIILKHMFDDRVTWTVLSDEGPAECEKVITLKDRNSYMYMTLQKWKNSHVIYVTVAGSNTTVINANRFHITSVAADLDDDRLFTSLRFFDEEKMVMNVAVEENEKLVA